MADPTLALPCTLTQRERAERGGTKVRNAWGADQKDEASVCGYVNSTVSRQRFRGGQGKGLERTPVGRLLPRTQNKKKQNREKKRECAYVTPGRLCPCGWISTWLLFDDTV